MRNSQPMRRHALHAIPFLAVVSSLQLTCCTMSVGVAHAEQAVPVPLALYDSDSQHLWNRLHAALFVRRDGRGELVGHDVPDPLLWHDTTHLVEGPSHDRALSLLDEFVESDGHNLIRDPLKRAVLQHDLWFVFDWLAHVIDPRRRENPATRALRIRVSAAMRKLALTRNEIEQLPDTWHDATRSRVLPPAFNPDKPDQAFLPHDLFDEEGPWVCLTRSGPDRITARLHARQLGARSVFLVFLRFPSPNRDEALDYLQKLNLFKRPIVLVKNRIGYLVSGSQRTPTRRDPVRVNPDVPQFPMGTQVALVRRMMVIDDQGELVPTGIVEMVQTRVYLKVNEGAEVTWKESPMQAFHEIRLQRAQLFAKQAGGLAGVTLSEPKYHHFFAHGEERQ